MDAPINMLRPEEIKEKLRSLLTLKQNGELDTEEKKGHDSISYDCLRSYVYHQDEEIKLNTLALVVESKKSTLKFTSEELDIIYLFLCANFKEKIEFVPLIKKALKRMKDSLAVMRRQCVQEERMRNHYKKNCSPSEMKQEILDESYRISCNLESDINMYRDTFQSLRNLCICGPDATYNRRRCSLQILLLMKDLLDNEFEQVTWKAEQVEALFNLMLLDTYEGNKEMSFKLIKSVDPSLLQLDDKNCVRDIIMIAIELGNSIRPIDSITAAYMLKVSILSPIVQDVLEDQFDLTKWTKDVPRMTVLQLILILLKKFKKSLVLAKQNIVKTITKHSLYGYLFCIRSLLLECNLKDLGKEPVWQNTVAELVSICFELSNAVSLIVNNSSPEGHIPMDLNLQAISEICGSIPDKEIVTPQMVLLCSWRTIKEVSLLFGLLVTEASICKDNPSTGLLNEEQITKIGEHLVSLLTETKHRGAFEQAHVGFSQLCSRLWRLNDTSLNQWPKVWLHQIFCAIIGIKENSKLCATRRSAGVPFMIQAILSTEPRKQKNMQTTTFDSVMKILLGLTQFESGNLLEKLQLMYSNTVFTQYENLLELSKCNMSENSAHVTEIKTHALNILRVIFRHSHLAEVVNNYIEDGLIAAIRSYDGSTWAERNAATLLFSALIIRIFGVQRTKDHINLTTDNKMNYRMFFQKYPNLLPFILNELQTFVAMDNTLIKSNVQPILLLLSRLYVSYNLEPRDTELKIFDLIDLVMQCARSPIFETRKLAARAFVSLLTSQTIGQISTVIEKMYTVFAKNTYSSLNLIHGYMLQVYEVLKHMNFDTLPNVAWDKFVKETTWILENLEHKNSKPPSFLLATVYINICNELYRIECQNTNEWIYPPMIHTIISHLLWEKLKQGPGRELYKLTVIKFIRSMTRETVLLEKSLPIALYLHNLRVPETQTVAWLTVTEIIDEINYMDESTWLLNHAISETRNMIQHYYRYSPELQDAIFDFLYNSLMSKSFGFSTKIDICKFVLNEMRVNDNKSGYCERDCYLRLLGKSYVTLFPISEDEKAINLECTSDVHNNFCDYLWITSLSGPFRKSVFEIMKDLFLMCYKYEKYRYVQVQWWTTVLQLLLDNNPEVRYEAYLILKYVPVNCTMILPHTNLLLSKFSKINSNHPEFVCVVYFYWSIALLDDADYEMDETDVFNKCTNYDFFEPVELSRICIEFLRENMQRYIDNRLPDDVIDWVNSVLNVECGKNISFRTFVEDYQSRIPVIEYKLRDVLNPTYKNKLLQILAYKQFRNGL
ncbi:thyroid adenoma-associated protein homolog [Xylocopa sonorina]|uniref:thyroid adenoma-associated protein homolog n=1 Tax=Xylocopa sonorina TaxID=1818115 RepID=UPI00403B2D7F